MYVVCYTLEQDVDDWYRCSMKYVITNIRVVTLDRGDKLDTQHKIILRKSSDVSKSLLSLLVKYDLNTPEVRRDLFNDLRFLGITDGY